MNFWLGDEICSRKIAAAAVTTVPANSACVDAPFEVEPIRQQNAKKALDLVLKYAGASFKRNAVDARIVADAHPGIP